MKSFFVVFIFGCASASGQIDAGIMAAQQASQQAQQAAQQAMDQATITSLQVDNSNLQMQQLMANASSSRSGPIIGSAIQPTYSVKPGKVNQGTVVHIKSATHYATIYYTTDGWTPTKASIRYVGPVTLDADTHFQAIAVGPNLLHSSVARADYTVGVASPTPLTQPVLAMDNVLRAGTTLRLLTKAETSSQTAEVGDIVPLLLDQDVKVGDTVFAAKGMPVIAILTVADAAAKYNVPGDLVLEVHSINVAGKAIPLLAHETLEGIGGRKPKEASIEPGMVIVARVAADTSLKP